VLRSLFGQKIDSRVDLVGAAMIVGGALMVALLASVIVGVSITRTITGAVHDLYEGTLKINDGDFRHRIPVRGEDQLAELSKSFNVMTSSLERLIEVEKEKERLHSELGIAREVQRQLFPRKAPKFPTLEVSGVCHAAQMVSGDYYDFLSLDSRRLAMAVGDVAGKGISAALLMAAIQSVLRTQLAGDGDRSPAHIVGLLNRQLYANTSPEKYATLYFSLYDDEEGVLTYTNAGHLPPILVRGGSASKLDVTGTVVGAFPVCRYEEKRVALEPGDLLVAYTDGITEPENAYGEMFGEERLMDLLVKYQNCEPGEIISRSIEAATLWGAAPEQEDDMTMVVARKLRT
jgi:sigma-B regulation protein RsbU (phosphoserine phosphatase)